MDFGAGTYALGYAAGVLSTLSPCVLPLLPILLATAAARHRYGPIALGVGLTLSFATVGIVVGALGLAIGGGVVRITAAVALTVFGVVLLSPALQQRFADAGNRLTASGEGVLARLQGSGWEGQFAVGLVLGLVWSPCVGPTLGAASTLAAQGQHLGQIGALMLIFGLGAATPLIVIGSVSREALARWRGRLRSASAGGNRVLGILFVLLGVAILTGWDKHLEAWALDHSPDWLTRLTTRY
ncbi:MAG: cytochrome c biogenesis protein CcdA [Proteobacteria bacterium]|nr:cytochrome c biogenesis protein CcdA [Pseudomonadota bacterium]